MSIFTSEGCFLTSFGRRGDEHGDEHGEFISPHGLAVDNAGGLVYVCDSGNDRIQGF